MKPTFHAGGQQGFSLIELMVAVTVVAVLSTWAWPNLQSWLQRRGVQVHAEAFRSAARLLV